jgi:hypothetical protein
MLVGILTERRTVGVPIPASADRETLIARVAPAIESMLAAVEE